MRESDSRAPIVYLVLAVLVIVLMVLAVWLAPDVALW